MFEGVGVYYLWGCAHGWWDLVGLRTPHVWGPCQRPHWCRRGRRCSHTYVETMILHVVMCGWLWRMAELATRGCCCRCNVCARGMWGGGWWWSPAACVARSGVRVCSSTLQHDGMDSPGDVRYGTCWQVWGSASETISLPSPSLPLLPSPLCHPPSPCLPSPASPAEINKKMRFCESSNQQALAEQQQNRASLPKPLLPHSTSLTPLPPLLPNTKPPTHPPIPEERSN